MALDAAPATADRPQERPAAVATKAPRFWLPVTLIVVLWAFNIISGWVEMVTFVRFLTRMGVALLFLLIFTVWWLTNRRILWRDRLLGFGALVAGVVVTDLLADDSVGIFGMLLFGVPVVLTVCTLWLLAARKAPPLMRRLGLAVGLLLPLGFLTLIRVNGIDGEQKSDFHWRWVPTAEDLYLAGRKPVVAPDASAPRLQLQAGDWPGFRGPERNSAVHGVKIGTDWEKSPPKLVWRQRVGPAWSSVIVVGDRLFTQEQRGKTEAVVCLDAATGREIWSHEDAVRFWDTVSGAGPRATPTFANGRIYALGARGTLNCLDAITGERQWSHDIAAESGAKVPGWGFCSSPLVVDNLVIVYAGGEADKGLLAYHAETGSPAWTTDAGHSSYSSPQLAALDGEPQVLFLSDRGLMALSPASGAVLWEHRVFAPGAPRILQPQVVGKTQVLTESEGDLGLALVDVSHSEPQWSATQRWASRDLKSSFNDFVVHEGHVYGFDGAIFTCVDLQTGKRRWRDGRYGHGQVLLLADQSLLLIVSETTGEVILVAADPQGHKELGQLQAIHGKTWNHPVIAHGRLYVRNAEEMACYEIGQVK
jgi:outer membrane protein assembly factor BamB